MFDGVKYKLYQRSLNRVLKRNNREIKFPIYTKVKSLGVISVHEIDVAKIFDVFGENVNVNTLIFFDEKREKNNTEAAIYSSDINFWNIPTSKFINDFINTPFDILLNITVADISAVEYVCAKSKAHFKVRNNTYSSFYDLIINSSLSYEIQFYKEVSETIKKFS